MSLPDNLFKQINSLKFAPLQSLLFSLAIIFLFLIVKSLVQIYQDAKNNKERHILQIDSYYKQLSGTDMKDLYSEWVHVLFDENGLAKMSNRYFSEELFVKSAEYCSNRTFKILVNFLQHSYKYAKDPNFEPNAGIVGIVYIAYIVAGLRCDFTGEYIDPMYLLRYKTTDFDSSIYVLFKCSREIKRNLKTFDKTVNKQNFKDYCALLFTKKSN